MDSDHRLLLRCAKPLLQSRNSAVCGYLTNSYLNLEFFFSKVVMAVAQLYYYVAPQSEVHIVAKALLRLLRHHR